jgi:hypothetical protein
MIHERLLAKYIHIATVVACYWYVSKSSFDCSKSAQRGFVVDAEINV